LTIYEGAEDTEFSFDDVLVNTPAYRAAFKQQTARNAASESRSSLQSPQSHLSSNPSLRLPFSRKSSGNSSPWDQAETIAASEATQESNDKKKKKRWNFVPLGRTISENAQAKKDQKQLQEKLCAAAKTADLMLVQELVELGAKPAEKTKRKQENCLISAVQGGSADIVKFLLDNGADPNAHDPDSGLACLGVAFTRHADNSEILNALLKGGAIPSDTYALGDESVGTGNIFHHLSNLVDKNPKIDIAATTRLIIDCNGLHEYSRLNYAKEYTPLQWACKKLKVATPESKERLRQLIAIYIRKGARIHDSYGKAVEKVSASDIFLTLCADGQNQVDVKFLLDQGANSNAINTRGDAKMAALHLACLAGEAETIEALIKGGAEIDVKDAEGQRPLHLAVKSANSETLSLLLNHGADPDAITTGMGQTPLHLACLRSTTPLSIIKRLAAANADLEIRDGELMTPLLRSCEDGGRKEVVAFLLDSNISVESRAGFNNVTPLLYAAASNNDVVLKYLIQKGANLEAVDDNGLTAVHYACLNSSVDALRLLLAKGANVNAADGESETPLHIVVRVLTEKKEKETRNAMILILIAFGANVLARNNLNLTPRDAAKICRMDKESMALLEEAEQHPPTVKRDIIDIQMERDRDQKSPEEYISQTTEYMEKPPVIFATPPEPQQSFYIPMGQPQCDCRSCVLARQMLGQPIRERYSDECLIKETAPAAAASPQYAAPGRKSEQPFGWERRVEDQQAYWVNTFTGERSYIKPTDAATSSVADPPLATPPPAAPKVIQYHSTYTPCGCYDCEMLPQGWECKIEAGELYYWNYLTFVRQPLRPTQ
jgi:ankyrin repeat protein